MIVAAHQPNYLPYLGFFHKMWCADVFIVYDTAQFSKNDFHNRNRIKTPKGPQWLTVPVEAPAGRAIREVDIDNSRDWADRHTRSLQANYARAPQFDESFDELATILRRPWSRLADLNRALIEKVKGFLDLRADLVLASSLDVPGDLPPTEKLVAMVRGVGGSVYLSGIGGRDYLSPEAFSDIRLEYDRFEHPTYPQPFGAFVPNLSALDALFVRGAAETRRLLETAGPRPSLM